MMVQRSIRPGPVGPNCGSIVMGSWPSKREGDANPWLGPVGWGEGVWFWLVRFTVAAVAIIPSRAGPTIPSGKRCGRSNESADEGLDRATLWRSFACGTKLGLRFRVSDSRSASASRRANSSRSFLWIYSFADAEFLKKAGLGTRGGSILLASAKHL